MATAISQCSFSLTPHHDRAYELSIDFSDWRGTSLSSKQIQFSNTTAPVEGCLWDVASINSKCGVPHFSWDDYNNIKQALALYTAEGSTGPIVVTLDLKDADNKYFSPESPTEEISSEEDVVCAFFQNPECADPIKSQARKIHDVFQKEHPVDFVLREGSLKKDLLKSGLFSEEEIKFFQGVPGKSSPDFCQLAEFVMNAAKFGSEARTSVAGFSLEKYVTSVAKVPASFGPFKSSTVLYPPLYKEMYSADGAFFRTLGSAFSIHGGYDPKSNITTVNVAAKV